MPKSIMTLAAGPNTQRPHNVLGYVNEPELQKYFYTPRVTEDERGYYNNHPSVKPIALMKWFIGIFVPENGIVLDPFMVHRHDRARSH
jgi:DNA modification methylase